MPICVIDTSAVFADLNEEKGAEEARYWMRDATKRVGLSHGDRACLALAKKMGLPAVTADRAWAEIADAIGVEVVLIR